MTDSASTSGRCRATALGVAAESVAVAAPQSFGWAMVLDRRPWSMQTMGRAYITDLTHFLDAEGEIPKTIPKEARALACFLALVADGVTIRFPNAGRGTATGIRCRGALDGLEDPVHWYCLDCGEHGTILNWRGTKWDRTRRQ